MLDSNNFKSAEKQQESSASSQPCDAANESPECEKEALSLAERMTGIAPRPRKAPRASR
jgi:hypothetical protein